MCVPVPVDQAGKPSNPNINKNWKVTGGLPPPQLDMLNQMMTPFRRAYKEPDPAKRREVFTDDRSMGAMLTQPKDQSRYRRPY